MTDRMIVCPECNGDTGDGYRCATCFDGTIPDRRRATPNDRAVDRIKALCECDVDNDCTTAGVAVIALQERITDIIREEAEREGP